MTANEFDQVIFEMWMDDKSGGEIARAIGRTTNFVTGRVRWMRKEGMLLPARSNAQHIGVKKSVQRQIKAGGPVAKRRCLCCGRDFLSSGIGHRICLSCKDSEIFSSALAAY